VTNREEKFDVSKLQICEMMGLVSIFRKNKMKKALLPRISLVADPGKGLRGARAPPLFLDQTEA